MKQITQAEFDLLPVQGVSRMIRTMTTDIEEGYLQHGQGIGPFRTEAVKVRHEFADNYSAFFEGRWRKVHDTMQRSFIAHNGEKITILYPH